MIRRIFDLLENYQNNFPDKLDALAKKEKGKWIRTSSEDYIRNSNLVSYALLNLGVQKGDKIITISNNRPEWNFLDMGLAQIGAVHVPLYPNISETSYDYIINHCEPVALIVSNEALFQKIHPLLETHPSIKHVYTFDPVEGAKHWEELLKLGEQAESRYTEELEGLKDSIQPEDLFTIIYTSGTTGDPKGVMLSHHNLVTNVLASAERLILNSSHRTLSILPINHVYERMVNYQFQYSGVSIYYAENMDSLGENLRELHPHGFATVPRILEKVYDKIMAKGKQLPFLQRNIFLWAVKLGQRYELNRANGWWYEFQLKIARKLVFSKWHEALGGNLIFLCCGGAALQERLARLFWAAGIPVQEGYGLTETSPIIAANEYFWPGVRFGTVGTILEGVEVKIAEDGEILVRGPNVMMGYFKNPELTRKVIDEEGWFYTGDIGCLENGKFLRITDRKKEIFKTSGGIYIAPQVIENKLKESPFIDQLMVVGESQKFPAAIIAPDFYFLKEYCRIKEIEYESPEQIIKNQQIVNRIMEEVRKTNMHLDQPKKIKSIRLVADTWSIETGELSPTLKLKRRELQKKYKDLIKDIYS